MSESPYVKFYSATDLLSGFWVDTELLNVCCVLLIEVVAHFPFVRLNTA